ncbi:MAG: NADH-quinone oxidoreductase subunit NuoE, partial [Planctomycetota bacterium]
MSELRFSAEGLKRYEWLLGRYPHKEAALLPALRIAEEEFGSLGEAEMRYVAELMGLPPAKVMGVVTFYTHYRRAGTGKYHLQLCSTLSCALRGCREVLERLREKLGIDVGETTDDGLFTLSKVECLASCGTAPVIQINDDYHEDVQPEAIDALIDRLRAEA